MSGDFYTYIVECSDGSFYTGWTNNLDARVSAHSRGKGARYTRSRRPVTLVYSRWFATKSEAASFEYAVKQMTRAQKELLIADWSQS